MILFLRAYFDDVHNDFEFNFMVVNGSSIFFKKLLVQCEQMTIAFTSIMALFIMERIDEKTGTISIIPLLLAGIISIMYWRQVLSLSLFLGVHFNQCDLFF